MVKKQNREKYGICHIPFLLSLVFIPLIVTCKYVEWDSNRLQSKHAIRLVLADTIALKKWNASFKLYEGNYIPKRNYIEISLTGNRQEDSTKLEFARIITKEIVSNNDSLNGIHFHFGDSTEYWEFVRAIDNLNKEGAKRYAPFDDDLLFFHIPEKKEVQTKTFLYL